MQSTLPDLHYLRSSIRAGRTSLQQETDRAREIANSRTCDHVFLKPSPADECSVPPLHHLGQRPLAGLAVSIKDLFDVAGQVTSAGSIALADRAVAAVDAVAVSRLRHAGANIVGRTNMTEFAFSGVGINPHFGTPVNPADRNVSRIPGGSSSGAAVSVATGAAHVGLGSDTGGSIRIPAALQGLVGFKSTTRLVPTEGTIPLSSTLDTVCALTRSVRDAILAHEILASRTVVKSPAPLANYSLALIKNFFQEGLDNTVAVAFERGLNLIRRAGARIQEINVPELEELAAMNAGGGLPAAESYAWHKELIRERNKQYDPRVLTRIQRGANMSACDYIRLHDQRRYWIQRLQGRLAGFDAILSPTVPVVAPPIADLAPGPQRDDAFFRVNGLLLRNTSVVNTFDGCAISLPCQAPGELPVGMMLWAGTLRDDTVLNIAVQIEAVLRSQLEAV